MTTTDYSNRSVLYRPHFRVHECATADSERWSSLGRIMMRST